MNLANIIRQHWAALRALLLLTVITGVIYPLAVWAIALLPGLHAKAEGSIIDASGKPVGSKLIGQSFTDKDGNPLPRYFQSRPSAAGAGYDPMASGATNLGPESIVDTPADPSKLAPGADPSTAGFKPGLLAQRRDRQARKRRRHTSVLHRRRSRRRGVGDRAPRLDRQRQPSDPGGQRQRTVLDAGKRTDHGLPAVLQGRAGAMRPIRSGLLGGSGRAYSRRGAGLPRRACRCRHR
jgi:hypothetical protein